MQVEMMVMRSVPNAAASTAATLPQTEMVSSIGIMTLKESATAGGTPSPGLTLSFSTPESLMKSVTARSPTMIAPNRPFVPVQEVESTPEASTPVRA